MIKVAFCRLDARDDPYTGYSTTGFIKGHEAVEMTREMETVHIFLEREYLTRVRALQDELAKKYGKIVNNLTSATPADEEAWGSALPKASFDKAEAEAKRQFPGKEAEYYT